MKDYIRLYQLLFVAAIVHMSMSDYNCLCNYNVELYVYKLPSTSSTEIGYMYEFDCKPLVPDAKISGWVVIAFEKKMGYIEDNPNVDVQMCVGGIPKEDKIEVQSTLPTTTATEASPVTDITPELTSTVSTSTHRTSTTSAATTATTLQVNTTTIPSTTTTTPLATTTVSTTLPTSTTTSSTVTITSSTTTSPMTSPTTSKTTTSPITSPTSASTTTTEPIETSSLHTLTSSTSRMTSPISMTTLTTSPITSPTTSTTTTTKSHKTTPTSTITTPTTSPIASPTTSTTTTTKPLKTTPTSTITTPTTSPMTSSSSAMSTLTSSMSPTTESTTVTMKTRTSTALPLSSSVATSTAPVNDTKVCPPRAVQSAKESGSQLTQFENNCYEVSQEWTSWPDAESHCNRNGGHLIHIANQDEQNFIYNFLVTIKSHTVWIGFHDQLNESNFEWTSGSPVTYTNWSPDRTTYLANVEDCGYITLTGEWNDARCDTTGYHHGYICQYETVSNITGNIDLCPDYVIHFANKENGTAGYFNDSCYALVTDRMSWPHADGLCHSRGGDLATITSAEEQQFIQRFLSTYSVTEHRVWIGLNDILNEGYFRWSSGSHEQYTNWAPDHIDNQRGYVYDDCGLIDISNGGLWDDYPCGRYNSAIDSDHGWQFPSLCQYKLGHLIG